MQHSVFKALDYVIVFDIAPFLKTGLYLPNAFIVKCDKKGIPTYMKQKAIFSSLSDLDIAPNPHYEALFVILQKLQPIHLAARFSKGKRNNHPLQKLLEDPIKAKAIRSFVDSQMNLFLRKIQEHHFLLSFELQRQTLAFNALIRPNGAPLSAKLIFSKERSEIKYKFRLALNEKLLTIRDHTVLPICNIPGWILLDKVLHPILHCNANMVKPFLSKDVVLIPERHIEDYFKKFIGRIANLVEIDLRGFELEKINTPDAVYLTPIIDIFSKDWRVGLYMSYRGTRFSWNDRNLVRTHIFQNEDRLHMLQIIRDPDHEKLYVEDLMSLGFTCPDKTLWKLGGAEREFLYKLSELKPELEKIGITLEIPFIHNTPVNWHRPLLKWEVKRVVDWLDIDAVVVIGSIEFPFKALRNNIKNDDPLFRLPDGQYFIIPEEWMTKYREVLELAVPVGDKLRLMHNQFTVLESLEEDAPQMKKNIIKEIAPLSISQHLKATLRPYQREGVHWLTHLYENGLGACLADDMGLGKTLQTIAVLLHALEIKKKNAPVDALPPSGQLSLFENYEVPLARLHALIVVPASLAFNWQSELKKFAPSLLVYRHIGAKRYKYIRPLSDFDITITTYQTALRDEKLLRQLTWEYIVLDESQYIKNRNSKVFKSLAALPAHHKISLSGTPIENALDDLWSQMQFINPHLLGSYSFFKKNFIHPIQREESDDKRQQLRKLIRPYLLRRTKEEVAKDLPPLTTKVVYTEMTKEQRSIYEKEKSIARNQILGNVDITPQSSNLIILQTLTRLRQIANHPKLIFPDYTGGSGKFTNVLEQWDIVRKSGHKALFFSTFVKHLELFRQQFADLGQAYSLLTGALSASQRQREIDRFEKQPGHNAFLITLGAGGTGLNLTAAEYVFLLDPWWNPAKEQQAIARAHRIGQKKHVIALKFVTKDTLEEKIIQLQQRKQKLSDDIIGQSQTPVFTREGIDFLLS